MLRSMTAEQYQEWQQFHELEPFDNDREEYLFGAIIQVLANANRPRGRAAYTLDEITPMFGDRPIPKKDWRAMKSLARDIVKGHNKKVRRKRRKPDGG
jgi:hypothetical protein